MGTLIQFMAPKVNTPCIKDNDINHTMENYHRLRIARRGAGYASAAAASRAFGWGAETYRAHENGQNGFTQAQARQYASAFLINVEWLISGIGAAKKSDGIDIEFEEFKGCYYSIDIEARKILLDLARRLSGGSNLGV